MAFFDVFNGDADGLCALQQLRLSDPRETTLVTGVKRDIGLLARVQAAAGDQITVHDVSLDKNREALLAWRDANYLSAALVYMAVYVAVVAFSLPGATVMTLTGGFMFGWAKPVPVDAVGYGRC